jgi:hypothetical protein
MARGQRLPDRPTEDNFASRGNSLAAEFGGIDAVGVATGAVYQDTAPPPKASAAPKGSTTDVYTGLCEALNEWQQGLVKSGTYKIADVYEIVFTPPSMADAELKKPGATDKSNVSMQQDQTAKGQLSPETNSMNVRSRTVPVTSGTQVIQFIDQVIRGSSYVSGQQTWQNDSITQEPVKNPSGNDRPTAWYKITVQVINLGFDTGRNDYAYKMVYIVTPYGINEVKSEYFPSTRFRGVHKRYNYWFTGKNIEVLSYEQNLNNLYFQVVSENLPLQRTSETNEKYLYKRSWQTRSDQSDQGAAGNTNEPAANLADYLYTQADFTVVNLKIIGDPAWLQQGESSGGVTVNNFSFSPFNNDDGINFEAQEICFSVTFNQPEDYNLDTGLVEVNSNFKTLGKPYGRNYPEQNQVYKAREVTSTFRKGRFEQDLVGDLLTEILKENKTIAPTNQRPTNRDADAQEGGFYGNTRSATNSSSSDNQWVDVNGLQTLQSDTVSAGAENEDQPVQLGTPQPAPPPRPPTSSGDIRPTTFEQTSSFAGRTSSFAGRTSPFAPQKIARDDQ